MKILILTTRIPYPPYRGDKLKIFNISKQLRRNNDVTILTFFRNKRELHDINSLQKLGFKVLYVNLSYLESIFNIIKAFSKTLPFQAAWFSSSKMHKNIRAVIDTGKYDVIYYHLIRTAQYRQPANSVLQVIDFTDSVSLYLKRFYEIEKNPFKKFFIGLEKKRIEEYEKIANKFDTLFICSPVDKVNLENKGINKIKLLPNGIDTNYFNSVPLQYEKNRIIFTGNLPYFPNIDAINYFTKDIYPLVLQKKSESKFYIVGQKPPAIIRKLASDKIIVTGFVEDIKTEYLKSAVTIAPMRFGAGTLNKVLESIALGVPIVATEMSVLGLPSELKKYVFTATGPKDFAEQILRILADGSIRNDLMQEGKEKIRELLSWEKIVDEFETFIKMKVKQ